MPFGTYPVFFCGFLLPNRQENGVRPRFLGADNVYAWAKEQAGEVSHQMFDTWMHRNGLSLNMAAEALGLSRRLVSYYRTAQKSIPRAIWLACLGWEATRPEPRTLPRGLPTAREYALAHA